MFLHKTICVAAAWLCMLSAVPLAQAAVGSGAGFDAGWDSDPWSKDPWAESTAQPLFPEPLFPKEDTGSQDMRVKLSNDIKRMDAAKNQSSVNAGQNIDQRFADNEVDSEMRRQMRAVAHWLYLYCLRNGSRFPGQGTSPDIMWAAQTQLTELVPNNPYNYGPTETINWGIPATFNANGSAASGSPVWNDQYQEGLHANQMNRVQLQFDYGLNSSTANYNADHPPQEWTAAPGTITAIGNNQGFFIVWGADRNGKPIRTSLNGRTFIISVSTSGTVNDTSAPNAS